MFGSTSAFGQSSSSPFGSQSVFGSNNASNNPFAPKPFGSTSPFGSQSGGSIFGGTSTGVFGATQSSSPLASTPTFGATSNPAFGSSAPAFGASSTPAFGTGSSSFGGSSVFGQKPAFGGFGSTPSQTSPFGSTFQQTQSAFGSNLFGSSTPFGGGSSQPAFGSNSTPAFGMTGAPAFGSTSTPAFGATSTPAFGATSTPSFGATSTPAFGSTGTAFGVSNTPAFGSGGAFGAASTPAFGSSTTSGFGASSTPAFGSSPTPLFGSTSSAFGASSTPSFSFGSSPSFGQSTSAFGSSPFGATPSPFGAQSSSFGSQSATSAFGSNAFGQSSFGGHRGGSRVTSYSPTTEIDGGSSTQPAGKLESIWAMPVYKDKSYEELRWEDYQLGDKGGPSPAAQPASNFGVAPAAQSNSFRASTPFGQSSSDPFSSTTSTNPFTSKPSTFGTSSFGPSSIPTLSSSPFGQSSTPNPFGSTLSTTPSLFTATSTSTFGSNSSPSLFGTQSSNPFSSSASIFSSSSALGTTSAFGNFGNTQSAGLFQSTTPSLVQTNSGFGQTTPGFAQTTPAFSQSTLFNTPSTGFNFTSSSNTSLLPTSNQTSFSTPFQTAQPAQTSGAFPCGNFGQTQEASNAFGVSGGFGQGTFGQPIQVHFQRCSGLKGKRIMGNLLMFIFFFTLMSHGWSLREVYILDLRDPTHDNYSKFLNAIREEVRDPNLHYGGTNLPVIAAPTGDFMRVDLLVQDDTVSLAVLKDDLYILAYMARHPQRRKCVYYFEHHQLDVRSRIQRIFPEVGPGDYRKIEGYTENYLSLQKVVGSRLRLSSGIRRYREYANNLVVQTFTIEIQATFIISSIQTVSEACRFLDYEEQVLLHFEGGFTPDPYLVALQDKWSTISKRIREAENGKLKKPIELTMFRGEKKMIKDIDDLNIGILSHVKDVDEEGKDEKDKTRGKKKMESKESKSLWRKQSTKQGKCYGGLQFIVGSSSGKDNDSLKVCPANTIPGDGRLIKPDTSFDIDLHPIVEIFFALLMVGAVCFAALLIMLLLRVGIYRLFLKGRLL